MDFIFATPKRSVSSQENAMVGIANAKSLTTATTGHKSLKGSTNGAGQQDMSARKKLSQLSNTFLNTPSGRRKLGNVSNTPLGGSVKFSKHITEDTFVKPHNLIVPSSDPKKKGAKVGTPQNVQCAPTLPTVPEEIENCAPVNKKELRENLDSYCAVDTFDHHNIMLVDSDDESQKENRKITYEKLVELI